MVYWKRGSAFDEDLKLSSLPAHQKDTVLDMAINISASVAVLVLEARRQKFGHP